MFTMAELHVRAAALMIRNPRWRAGQAYFLALDLWYDLPRRGAYISCSVTSFDPFYNDSNLERFFSYMRYQLGEYDSEITAALLEWEADGR